jgi:hypothetical protein
MKRFNILYKSETWFTVAETALPYTFLLFMPEPLHNDISGQDWFLLLKRLGRKTGKPGRIT